MTHIEIDSSIKEDPEMKQLSDECVAKVGAAMDEVIGETAIDLDARFCAIRTQETNIGNFITDLMKRALKADIAAINAGTLRADCIFEKGPIRVRDLCSLVPMLEEMCLMEFTGTEILGVLNNGVSKYPRLEGRFLQVSGVSFTFDAQKPEENRVLEETVKVGGEPLVPTKIYRLVTLDFMRNGKDGFTIFRTAPCIADGEQAGIMPTMVREHFLNLAALNGDCDTMGEVRARRAMKVAEEDGLELYSSNDKAISTYAIHPQVEGRIICLNPDPAQLAAVN